MLECMANVQSQLPALVARLSIWLNVGYTVQTSFGSLQLPLVMPICLLIILVSFWGPLLVCCRWFCCGGCFLVMSCCCLICADMLLLLLIVLVLFWPCCRCCYFPDLGLLCSCCCYFASLCQPLCSLCVVLLGFVFDWAAWLVFSLLLSCLVSLMSGLIDVGFCLAGFNAAAGVLVLPAAFAGLPRVAFPSLCYCWFCWFSWGQLSHAGCPFRLHSDGFLVGGPPSGLFPSCAIFWYFDNLILLLLVGQASSRELSVGCSRMGFFTQCCPAFCVQCGSNGWFWVVLIVVKGFLFNWCFWLVFIA